MKIVDIFFNIINKISSNSEQKYLLKTIHLGDVVWAKMPLPFEELVKIESSHRIRPYLIMWKDFANVYAFQSSSKRRIYFSNFETYRIGKERYGNKKDSWFDLTNIVKVPINNLECKMYTLKKEDITMIEKRLQILKNRNKYLAKTFNVLVNFCEGDIVTDGSTKYYVVDSDDLRIYCYILTQNGKECGNSVKKVKIDGKFNYIYLDKKVVIEKSKVLRIIDIAYIDEVLLINQFRKRIKIKKNKNIDEDIKMGTVFEGGNRKFVYLYKENKIYYGVDYDMYKVFPRIIPIYDIESKDILEVYDIEKIYEIVLHLNCNLKNPTKKIRKLYKSLEELVL